jgi:protein-disulfide isomerase
LSRQFPVPGTRQPAVLRRPARCRGLLWAVLAGLLAVQAGAQNLGQVSRAGIEAVLAPPLMPAPEGDPQADVTVVEYFDYQCPVCRQMEPELAKLLQRDPHVRVVYKDWPILGALSVYAAYCGLAAAHFGHYDAARRALWSAHGDFKSREQIEGLLRAAGLDVAQIKAFVAAQHMELGALLTRNHGEARALGLRGTPGVVVGEQRVAGGLQLEQLQLMVQQARSARQGH